MRLGSEGPQGLTPSEGLTEPEASSGDSNILLCRQTMAVTLSVAACVPTIRVPCTACAPCKPGEPRSGRLGQGAGLWGTVPTAALTHPPTPQPPVRLWPAVLLHGGRHTAPDS